MDKRHLSPLVLFALWVVVHPSVVGAVECVILLHGMGRSNSSMSKMETKISEAGFSTINYDYPSTSDSITNLANTVVPDALERCPATAERIHFVTHSLGGILVRAFFQKHPPRPGTRAVMLGPPNQGSEVAEKLKGWGPYRWVMGEAGQALGTGTDSVPLQLGPIDMEVGIIAGTQSFNPLLSHWLPGPDDGKVAVEKTKLSEMKDFVVLKTNHSFMMRNRRVIEQAVHFLRHGNFDHGSANDAVSTTNNSTKNKAQD